VCGAATEEYQNTNETTTAVFRIANVAEAPFDFYFVQPALAKQRWDALNA